MTVPSRAKGGRTVAVALASTAFLAGTSEFMVAGLLPQIARDFGVPVTVASLTITVFAVGMIVGAPAVALATVRIPRRATLVTSLFVFAIGVMVAATTETFAVLLAARGLTAVVTGAFWAVGTVAAADAAAPGAASRAIGLVLGGSRLAVVVGVPLASVVGQLVGWRGAFWILAGLAVIAAVGVRVVLPSAGAHHQNLSFRDELTALRSGRLWLTLVCCSLATFSVMSIYSYVTVLITDASLAPLALAVFGTGALVGSLGAGYLGDRRPFISVSVLMVLTAIVAMGISAFANNPEVLVVLLGALGLTGLSCNPIFVSLAMRSAGRRVVLAGALPTSFFNIGTAAGTAATAVALQTSFGVSAPGLVASAAALALLIPLAGLVALVRKEPEVVSSSSERAAVSKHR